MTSKSKDIRRAMCEFLDQLLHTWPTHILEKHVALIQIAVSNGIKDADPDARAYSRKYVYFYLLPGLPPNLFKCSYFINRAYGGFASHFPAQADALLHSLDLSYQKLLHGEATLSNSSSSHSLQSIGLTRSNASSLLGPSSLPVQPRLKIGSSENLSRIPGIPLSRKTPVLAGRPVAHGNGVSASANVRSISAIDLQAANRAVRNIRGAYVAPLRKFRCKIYIIIIIIVFKF
jgi:CLIP-associating protein 1/2